jgi:CheY-like chemotaxis protein/tetratricopeptide (TPR) repeat protein
MPHKNLTDWAASKEADRTLSFSERALECCRLAKQLEDAGEYEAACEALGEFWPDRNKPPALESLDQATKAEVLLRVGALVGWTGRGDQAKGSQEEAKNLISQSIAIFEALRETRRVAEARCDLAFCYWREGAFDEARIVFLDVISHLGEGDEHLKAVALLRRALVEKTAGRYHDALVIYTKATPVVESTNSHSLKGKLHNGLGTLLNCFGQAESQEDYIDRSLVEFAAASYHFEQAGHDLYRASVENNLGYLFFSIGRFKEAHVHLDQARWMFLKLQDEGYVAQVDETRARALLAEGRIREAERFARLSVKTLEKGGEQALLAEALTTHGIALARMGRHARSRALLERAIEIAETAGDLEGAGRARLSIIEELGEQTSARELASIYQAAADLLQRSQDPSASKRLISCARKIIDALGASESEDQELEEYTREGLSFRQRIVTYEKALIERALRDAGGSVTQAARLLGFKHHQSLISLINSRHKDLLKTRSAVRKRKRHIVVDPQKTTTKPVNDTPEQDPSQISILHVEDNKLVAKVLDEMFAGEKWLVELCMDSDRALRKLTGNRHYDLLLVDNELPGLSGVELVRRARKMTHRRRTPIIMLSGAECETEAWRAGVDAFLKKPEEINDVPSTIVRLLKTQPRHK